MTVDSSAAERCAPVPVPGPADWSGLEIVAKLADGSIRRPPMADKLPFILLPPEPGKVMGTLSSPGATDAIMKGDCILAFGAALGLVEPDHS